MAALLYCPSCVDLDPRPGRCVECKEERLPALCRHCKQPMEQDQLRYVGGELRSPPTFAHGDCRQKESDDLDKSLRALDRKLGNHVGSQLADMFKRIKL